jgi:hypothetical protein
MIKLLVGIILLAIILFSAHYIFVEPEKIKEDFSNDTPAASDQNGTPAEEEQNMCDRSDEYGMYINDYSMYGFYRTEPALMKCKGDSESFSFDYNSYGSGYDCGDYDVTDNNSWPYPESSIHNGDCRRTLPTGEENPNRGLFASDVCPQAGYCYNNLSDLVKINPISYFSKTHIVLRGDSYHGEGFWLLDEEDGEKVDKNVSTIITFGKLDANGIFEAYPSPNPSSHINEYTLTLDDPPDNNILINWDQWFPEIDLREKPLVVKFVFSLDEETLTKYKLFFDIDYVSQKCTDHAYKPKTSLFKDESFSCKTNSECTLNKKKCKLLGCHYGNYGNYDYGDDSYHYCYGNYGNYGNNNSDSPSTTESVNNYINDSGCDINDVYDNLKINKSINDVKCFKAFFDNPTSFINNLMEHHKTNENNVVLNFEEFTNRFNTTHPNFGDPDDIYEKMMIMYDNYIKNRGNNGNLLPNEAPLSKCTNYKNNKYNMEDYSYKTKTEFIADNEDNLLMCALDNDCKLTNKDKATCRASCKARDIAPNATCAVGCTEGYQNKPETNSFDKICQPKNEGDCTSDERCFFDSNFNNGDKCSPKSCPTGDQVQTPQYYNFKNDELDRYCVKNCDDYMSNDRCEDTPNTCLENTKCELRQINVPVCEPKFTQNTQDDLIPVYLKPTPNPYSGSPPAG